MVYLIKKFIFFFLVFFYCNLLFAESFSSFQDFQRYIDNIILASIPTEAGEKIEITILQLNEQNILPYCKSDFDVSLAHPGLSSPTNTVLLSCKGENPSILYVPVQIKLMTDMISAARRIMPGEVITEKDIVIKKFDKYQVYDEYFQDISKVNGLVAARLIPPGSIILKKSIAKSLFIKKNQPVTLIFKEGPIEVSMSGVAQMDGYLNDTIKIVNPSSKKIVDGTIIGPGKVEIH
ncbi:hypothetical protein EP47_05040 [Legionella norrlandica]|uniref:Flagella basal body P-ring formation protein FlgA n=1 Tax=Legionella norrlandica TaxID=1498499 RepID=A0A0A2SRH4_9GAMM|nr:flagellar basal body P-ring formation chaperone FlgA [Legionella norrlandica]KGP63730.1 hypothetical protein EP47_05040 [Legionella norrlandica]